MQVTLISYTQFAKELLIFTKNTRLNMTPGGLKEVMGWTEERKQQELEYMARTIPSSWEFADLTFMIEKCSRAFTHQLVRTRNASYAQQTMRVLPMESFSYHTGPSIDEEPERQAMYDSVMRIIQHGYNNLLERGTKIEDARGILPTDILTNIVMKINLRGFCELVKSRNSARVQGEYRDFLQQATEQARMVWPWIDIFLEPKQMSAKQNIMEYLQDQMRWETEHFGVQPNLTKAWSVMKELDILTK